MDECAATQGAPPAAYTSQGPSGLERALPESDAMAMVAATATGTSTAAPMRILKCFFCIWVGH